jgi:hypothetical protein
VTLRRGAWPRLLAGAARRFAIATSIATVLAVGIGAGSAHGNGRTPISFSEAPDFKWAVGDYNGDGSVDVWAIKVKNTDSGRVEVWVLDGANSYQRYLKRSATTIDVKQARNYKSWHVGDYDRDGSGDLYGIRTKAIKQKRIAVRVVSGGADFKTDLIYRLIPLSTADAPRYTFGVAHYDDDRYPDLYTTEVGFEAGDGDKRVRTTVYDGDPRARYRRELESGLLPISDTDARGMVFRVGQYTPGSAEVIGLEWRGKGNVRADVVSADDGEHSFERFLLEDAPLHVNKRDHSSYAWGFGQADYSGGDDLIAIKRKSSSRDVGGETHVSVYVGFADSGYWHLVSQE